MEPFDRNHSHGLTEIPKNDKFDKKHFKRIYDHDLLESDKKKTLFDLIDTYIRDAKARQAYS